jgi:hypothetical protein
MGDTSSFYSMCVDGGTIYAGGMSPDGSAFYWTSGGGLRSLSAGRGAVLGVCVSGGRLHAAGFEATGDDDARGVVWGGDGAVLHDLGPGTCIYALAASDGRIYAAGYDGSDARVWRDGEVVCGIDESAPGEEPNFNAVAVAGGVVYAAGDMGDGRIYRPFWTKSDDPVVRFLGSGAGNALAMQVSGGEIYIAGYDGGGGRVWKGPVDGSAPLAVAFDLGIGWPYSMSVAGGDVYTGGNLTLLHDGRVLRNSTQMREFGPTSGVQAICVVD